MRLIFLLAAVGVVAALPRNRSTIPKDPRRARWAALPVDVKDENLDLLFVQAMWRHGDRASEHAVPGKDAFTEDDWQFGGGGYGELSPEGMKMHFELGRKLRKRYVTDTFKKFLSEAYNAKEIYIRSTDYNRTLISAYSNLAGMYSGFGVEGQNLPTKDDVPDWPTGFVPIPVHTVDYTTDYVGRPDFDCDRQDQLYDLVKNSAEYQNYINDPQNAQILAYLSESTGTDVNIDNIYELNDPLFCEKNHIADLSKTGQKIEDVYPWFYTGEIPALVEWINDKDEDFTNGLGNPAGVNGINISVEIPKIRAGGTLKFVVGNVNGVLACKNNMDSDECRTFYKKLKYYALSAHDTTLSAFLTILGVKKYVVPEGYPNYSAAILIEVFEDRTTGDRYFKVLYHADKDDDFKPVTAFVHGCDVKANYCPVSVLNDLVKNFAPETDMVTLCNTPVDGSAPVTTTPKVAPAQTTPTVPTTTTKTTTTTTTTTQNPTTSSVSSISLLSAVSVMIVSALL